jgi:hypothetical protein
MRSLTIALILLTAATAEAAGYKRGLTHRPRATFDARDAAHVTRTRDRILAQQRPWADAYAALRDLAENGTVVAHGAHPWRSQPDKWAVLYGREVQNGLVARAKAAVAWLGVNGVDPAWRPLPRLPGQATPEGWLRQQARESAAIIDGMFDRFPGWKGWGVLNRGIVSSESLMVHAQAWDLLAALPGSWGLSLSRGRSNLIDLAEDHQLYAPIVSAEKDNHRIRIDSGVAVAGIVFGDHAASRWWKPWTWFEDPADWVGRAERTLDPERSGSHLRHQVESGAYAEGTAYHAYAEELYSPFMMAYTRFDGAKPLLQSARLDRAHRWNVALRLPDGLRAPVDNAGLTSFRSGYVVNRLARGSRDAAQRQLMGWDWVDQGYAGITGSRALDLLAAYDPSDADAQAIATYAAPAASAFLADEGEAALRSGGGRDAAFAMLTAERGSARTAGTGHDAADPLHVFVYAEGDVIALSPGYAGFSQVTRTNQARHHNLVLVDGKGPRAARKTLLGYRASDADATLEAASPRTFDGPRLRSAEGRTEYEGVTLRRTLTLIGDRALVIEDRAESSRDHDLTLLYHAPAGGNRQTPATLTGLGLSFLTQTRQAPVEVATDTTRGAPRLALGREFDALGGGGTEHAVLQATVRARRANLLTIVVWGPPGSAPAAPVRLATRPGSTALAGTWAQSTIIAVSQEAPGAFTIPASATTPEVETDGTLAIVHLLNGQLQSVVAHDATLVRVAAQRFTRATAGTIRP